jgi:hypothetical protein
MGVSSGGTFKTVPFRFRPLFSFECVFALSVEGDGSVGASATGVTGTVVRTTPIVARLLVETERSSWADACAGVVKATAASKVNRWKPKGISTAVVRSRRFRI